VVVPEKTINDGVDWQKSFRVARGGVFYRQHCVHRIGVLIAISARAFDPRSLTGSAATHPYSRWWSACAAGGRHCCGESKCARRNSSLKT
jgi:hypothetical protein